MEGPIQSQVEIENMTKNPQGLTTKPQRDPLIKGDKEQKHVHISTHLTSDRVKFIFLIIIVSPTVSTEANHIAMSCQETKNICSRLCHVMSCQETKNIC